MRRGRLRPRRPRRRCGARAPEPPNARWRGRSQESPPPALYAEGPMQTPDVEILWWEGCPSTDRALADVRRLLAELGLGEVDVRLRAIQTEAQAKEADFVGSPTILIDGVDPFPAVPYEDFGLSCRIYRRRDGRI